MALKSARLRFGKTSCVFGWCCFVCVYKSLYKHVTENTYTFALHRDDNVHTCMHAQLNTTIVFEFPCTCLHEEEHRNTPANTKVA